MGDLQDLRVDRVLAIERAIQNSKDIPDRSDIHTVQRLYSSTGDVRSEYRVLQFEQRQIGRRRPATTSA